MITIPQQVDIELRNMALSHHWAKEYCVAYMRDWADGIGPAPSDLEFADTLALYDLLCRAYIIGAKTR